MCTKANCIMDWCAHKKIWLTMYMRQMSERLGCAFQRKGRGLENQADIEGMTCLSEYHQEYHTFPCFDKKVMDLNAAYKIPLKVFKMYRNVSWTLIVFYHFFSYSRPKRGAISPVPTLVLWHLVKSGEQRSLQWLNGARRKGRKGP